MHVRACLPPVQRLEAKHRPGYEANCPITIEGGWGWHTGIPPPKEFVNDDVKIAQEPRKTRLQYTTYSIILGYVIAEYNDSCLMSTVSLKFSLVPRSSHSPVQTCDQKLDGGRRHGKPLTHIYSPPPYPQEENL